MIDEPPATWQETYELAKAADPPGIAYQGAAYEGLTVDFLELAFAAGGKVLSEDGEMSEFDSPANIEALEFSGRRHQGRRRAQGRHDLYGRAGAASVRGPAASR